MRGQNPSSIPRFERTLSHHFRVTFSHGRGRSFSATQDLSYIMRPQASRAVLQGNAQYFHNISQNGNHWILLKLVGVKSNRMGLGAQVRITTDAGVQYNHATTSTGYACSSDPRVHFGLGPSKVVKEIDIVWPSRIHQTLRNVPADQVLTITETEDRDY